MDNLAILVRDYELQAEFFSEEGLEELYSLKLIW